MNNPDRNNSTNHSNNPDRKKASKILLIMALCNIGSILEMVFGVRIWISLIWL